MILEHLMLYHNCNQNYQKQDIQLLQHLSHLQTLIHHEDISKGVFKFHFCYHLRFSKISSAFLTLTAQITGRGWSFCKERLSHKASSNFMQKLECVFKF